MEITKTDSSDHDAATAMTANTRAFLLKHLEA